jgi:hypothetical protein
MNNYYRLYKDAEYKRNNAEESAARARLYKQAKAAQPGNGAQLLAKLARMLMGAGERLEAYLEEEPQTDMPFEIHERWLQGLDNSSPGGIFI